MKFDFIELGLLVYIFSAGNRGFERFCLLALRNSNAGAKPDSALLKSPIHRRLFGLQKAFVRDWTKPKGVSASRECNYFQVGYFIQSKQG
jgi:hypothetical protein